jgi:hypothetical protein
VGPDEARRYETVNKILPGRSLTLAVLKEMLVVSRVLRNRDRRGQVRAWFLHGF